MTDPHFAQLEKINLCKYYRKPFNLLHAEIILKLNILGQNSSFTSSV